MEFNFSDKLSTHISAFMIFCSTYYASFELLILEYPHTLLQKFTLYKISWAIGKYINFVKSEPSFLVSTKKVCLFIGREVEASRRCNDDLILSIFWRDKKKTQFG